MRYLIQWIELRERNKTMTNFFEQVQIKSCTKWERVKQWWRGTRIYRWIYRKRFIFPPVKRVFPEFLTKDFVAVQPMNESSGKVFYLDFKHGEPNSKHYQQV
jgi:hypothetical protein